MARRPNVQSDRDDWGAVLNEYLDVSLDEDGTIRDEVVAALPISDATQAALSRVAPPALRLALDEGMVSTGIQVLGDSTGNGTDEWPHLLALDLAAAYPAYEVRHYIWTGTVMPAVPLIVQVPPNEARHLPFTLSNSSAQYFAPSVTGDLDVRVLVEPDAWATGAEQVLAARFGGAGQRAWRLQIGGGGSIDLEWRDAAGESVGTASSGAWGAPAGPVWVRATIDVDNGAGGSDTKLYSSTDGVDWTQRGTTTTTSPATTIFDADETPYEIGARGNNGAPLVGKLYEVQIRDGIDGPLVAPALPEHWEYGTSTAPSPVGDPILTFVNGSHSGADTSVLAPNIAKMSPNYGQQIAIISTSHNEGVQHGSSLYKEIQDGLITPLRARITDIRLAACTQNPRIDPADRQFAQAMRRIEYLNWQDSIGWLPIDTYGAFLANAPVSDLVNEDGFHPNAAGSRVWADAVASALGLL